jgi:hypothetical protein
VVDRQHDGSDVLPGNISDDDKESVMAWKDDDLKGQGGDFEYVFSIHKSYAGYTEYNDGKTCLLILEGEKEYPSGKVEDSHMWIGVPDNQEGTFEPRDGEGTGFLHTSGDPDKRFSPQSKIQKFIRSAVEVGVPLEERGDSSLDASMWAGLKLRIKEERQEAKVRGESRAWNQPLVVEYLGELQGGSTSSSAPSSTSNGSGDVEAQAREIAKAANDPVEYLERAKKELGVDLGHPVMTSEFYAKANA